VKPVDKNLCFGGDEIRKATWHCVDVRCPSIKFKGEESREGIWKILHLTMEQGEARR
jgi:hypothetical protein